MNSTKSDNYHKVKDAKFNSYINASTKAFKIESWGYCDVPILTSEEEVKCIRLLNMAYIPDFLTSIISLDILASKGTH